MASNCWGNDWFVRYGIITKWSLWILVLQVLICTHLSPNVGWKRTKSKKNSPKWPRWLLKSWIPGFYMIKSFVFLFQYRFLPNHSQTKIDFLGFQKVKNWNFPMIPHEFHRRNSPWWHRTTVAASHCPSQATAWWELGMGLRDNHNYNIYYSW